MNSAINTHSAEGEHSPSFSEADWKLVETLIRSRWLYRRIGYDERVMTFNVHGEVEFGAGEVEKFWQITWVGGRILLELRSDHSLECSLTFGPDGIWRGRWEHFEQMPVELIYYSLRFDETSISQISCHLERTFSQWGEQQFLHNFFGEQCDGRFLDIGAADGVLFSNTRSLFLKGWSGALVEPIPEFFWRLEDRYEKTPNIKLLNAAVCDRDGYGTIWACTAESRLRGDTRDTMDGTFASAAREALHPAAFVTREIRLVSAATMLKKFGWMQYDLMSVDAEGLDGLIIRGVLEANVRPRLILWEADKCSDRNQETQDYLKFAGYKEVYHNGINCAWTIVTDGR